MTDQIIELEEFRYNKYQHWDIDWDVDIDSSDGFRASSFKILSCQRPHMRSFWLCNLGHRCNILLWFSFNPLLFEIHKTVQFTEEELWISIIATLSSSFLTVIISGIICHKYGARLPLSFLILLVCIPTVLVGAIQTGRDLIIVRFFMGIAGGSFAISHFWISLMFTPKTGGVVHGFTGALGGVSGIAMFLIGSICFPIMRYIAGSSELGWRLSLLPPVFVCAAIAVLIISMSDDTPQGNFSKLKKKDIIINTIKAKERMIYALRDKNVWILGSQFSFNLGSEIIFLNVGLLYLKRYGGLSEESSIVASGCFAVMSQISRMLAGRISDFINQKLGMFFLIMLFKVKINLWLTKLFKYNVSTGYDGRIIFHVICMSMSGFSFFVFASSMNERAIFFSMLVVQLLIAITQGATLSMLSVFNRDYVGSALGVMGALGNLSAICFSAACLFLPFQQVIMIIGGLTILSALLSTLIEPSNLQLVSSKRTVGTENLTEEKAKKDFDSINFSPDSTFILSMNTRSDCS